MAAACSDESRHQDTCSQSASGQCMQHASNLVLTSLLVVLTVMPVVHHQPVQCLLPVWGC